MVERDRGLRRDLWLVRGRGAQAEVAIAAHISQSGVEGCQAFAGPDVGQQDGELVGVRPDGRRDLGTPRDQDVAFLDELGDAVYHRV
ncbi:hypothetical protein GCM10027446_18700 [Angustibacter peucedani]